MVNQMFLRFSFCTLLTACAPIEMKDVSLDELKATCEHLPCSWLIVTAQERGERPLVTFIYDAKTGGQSPNSWNFQPPLIQFDEVNVDRDTGGLSFRASVQRRCRIFRTGILGSGLEAKNGHTWSQTHTVELVPGISWSYGFAADCGDEESRPLPRPMVRNL